MRITPGVDDTKGVQTFQVELGIPRFPGLYWLLALLGIGTLLAPYALRFSETTDALVTSLATGSAVAGVAGLVALAQPRRDALWAATLSWVGGFAGAWLIVAPFILQYSSELSAVISNAIFGSFIIALAGVGTLLRPGLDWEA
jgi:hypothetical protein